MLLLSLRKKSLVDLLQILCARIIVTEYAMFSTATGPNAEDYCQKHFFATDDCTCHKHSVRSTTHLQSHLYWPQKPAISIRIVHHIPLTPCLAELEQIHGSSGADLTMSIIDGERWKTSVWVNNSQSFCHQLLKIGEDGAKLE